MYTNLLMKATLLKAINDLIEYNPVAFVLTLAFVLLHHRGKHAERSKIKMGHPSMPRWRYTVTDPIPTHCCALQRYKQIFKLQTSYEQNFIISKEKQPLQASHRRFDGHKGTSQYKLFDFIYCIHGKSIIQIKKPSV